MKQVQSYYSVIMRSDFSVYEMRIFLKIVRRAQPLLRGRKYSDLMRSGVSADGINLNFSFPLSEILHGSHNSRPLKQAILHMEKEWIVEYYSAYEKKWRATSVIYNVEIDEARGMLSFSCAKWLVDYIADVRNGGFRVYDFETAMSLSNARAARFYLLLSSETRTLSYKVGDLKRLLGIPASQYPRADEFVRRVVAPASEFLKEKQVDGFTFRYIKGKEPSVALHPVKRQKKELNISEQKEELSNAMPEVLRNYLVTQLHFTVAELYGNRRTIERFVTVNEDWQYKFFSIVERMRRKRKNHGYLLNAMKRESVT